MVGDNGGAKLKIVTDLNWHACWGGYLNASKVGNWNSGIFSMENEWEIFLWSWKVIPLNPDKNQVLVAKMLHKIWITHLVPSPWVDLGYPLTISSLEWNLDLHSILMTMSMPNVWNCIVGSVIYAVWRPRTKWGLKCSILVMALYMQMELMVPSGYAAKNARKPITWNVLLKKKKKKLSSPFFALLMNVGGRDLVK